ncbi:MAG: Multidrug resistance protein Stp [Pseudomonas citronellolis]|nr:MAG: Multidrug resistance protein Stp [Pseudomonas citronellolis]
MPTALRSHLALVQLATCLGFAVVLVDVSVVNVALDALRTAFTADMSGLQWVVNAYALVFAAALLLAGALGDRFGARRVFMGGFALFTVASLGCGLAPSLAGLIGWRVAQGLGAALLVPTSLAVLRQAFDDAQARGRAIGWWGAAGGIALAAGPVLGGLLVAHLGWRSIFLLNLPVGLLGLWLAARYAPHSPKQAQRSLDLPGQVTCALSLALLTFGLTEAGVRGWGDGEVLGLFIGAGLAALAFFRLQAGNPQAMLPLALLRQRTVASAMLIGLVANLSFYGVVFALSLFFQSVWQLDPQRTGLAFLPMTAVLMAMNLLAGRLAGRCSERRLVALGLALSALGYAALLPGVAQGAYAWLMLPMLLAGAGIALAIPTFTHAVLTAVPAQRAGIAAGLLNAARQLGGVIGVALFGGFIRNPQPAALVHGLQQALLVCAVLLLGAAGLALWGLGANAKPVESVAPCA